MQQLRSLLRTSPLLRLTVYCGFMAVFFHAGLAATTWLVAPERLGGDLQRYSALLFPILLPAFFAVNRYLGCGRCCAGPACPPGGGEDHPPR